MEDIIYIVGRHRSCMDIIREYQLNRKYTRLILREPDLRGIGNVRLYLCHDAIDAVGLQGYDLIMQDRRYRVINEEELERRNMANENEITIEELIGKLRRDGVHIDKCVFTCRQQVSEFHYMKMSEDKDRQKHVQNSIAGNVARQLLESAVRDKIRFDEELDTSNGVVNVTGRMICMTAQELDNLIQNVITAYNVIRHPRSIPMLTDPVKHDMEKKGFSSRGILNFITNNFPPMEDNDE